MFRWSFERRSSRQVERGRFGLARNGVDPDDYLEPLLGEPERIADRLRPYLALGFEHLIVPLPSAEDEETIDRVHEGQNS